MALISSVVLGNIFFVKKPDSGFGGFAGEPGTMSYGNPVFVRLLSLLVRQPVRGLSNAVGTSGVLHAEWCTGMTVTSGSWAECVRIGFWWVGCQDQALEEGLA